MKADRGSHVTMTFSKATRLFSRWSNSGKSSSSSCDSRAVSSATARKSLACEARLAIAHALQPPGGCARALLCLCVCLCLRGSERGTCRRERGTCRRVCVGVRV